MLLHLQKEILLKKGREFFSPSISLLHKKITSSFLPSQRCAKQQSNIFVHTLHCQQNQYFGKTKNPFTEVLMQGFHFTFSSPKDLVITHGRLTAAAAQLLQRCSGFLTLYVSRHNCTASFADWNY